MTEPSEPGEPGPASQRAERVAVYDLHWRTAGGGEQVAGATVEAFVSAGHDVDMLGPDPVDPVMLRERLGVDVSGATFRAVDGELGAAAASSDYDLFVNVTYRSTAPCHARAGLYYVHFPEPPRTAAGQLGDALGRAAILAVDRTPLRRVRPLSVARDEVALRTRQRRYLATYDGFAGNSQFTNEWVRRLWGVEPVLLHPPVRPLTPAARRRRTIVSVGRFFEPRHGHSKKQLEMVETFRTLVGRGRIEGWELVLLGGCDADDREYLLEVRRAALGLPVTIHVNAPGDVVASCVGEASIYWHAAGFGEEVERHPERFEHFGIAVVEAMSVGAVPVVFDAAGPSEIVVDGVSGRRWQTLDELADITGELIGDEWARAGLSAGAIARSADFTGRAFHHELLRITADLIDPGARPPASE